MMDDITYSEILPDRYNDVIQHLRFNFNVDEPINKSISLCKPGEAHKEFEEYTLDLLKKGMSFMATVKNTGEVIGVIVNGNEDNTEYFKNSYKDLKLQKLFDFLEYCINGVDMPKTEKILEVKILGVDNRYRGKRIASKLYEVTEKFAICNGFNLIRAEATSLFSQKLFDRFGFITLKEIGYNDYPTGEDPWFNVEPPHTSLKVMIKRLN